MSNSYRPRKLPELLDANGNPIVPRRSGGYRKPGTQAVNLDEREVMAFTAVIDGAPGHLSYGRQLVTNKLNGELGKGVRSPVGVMEAGPDSREVLMLRMIEDEGERDRLRSFFEDHPLAWLVVGTCRAEK